MKEIGMNMRVRFNFKKKLANSNEWKTLKNEQSTMVNNAVKELKSTIAAAEKIAKKAAKDAAKDAKKAAKGGKKKDGKDNSKKRELEPLAELFAAKKSRN